jgi:fluoride exporter
MGSRQATAYLLVAIGGGIGSALRYHAAVSLGARPLTTFGVNIVGSFLIGLLAAMTNNVQLRLFLGVGILGGFTTFSAWQLEALASVRGRGFPIEFVAILLGSLTVGFLACWSGYALGARLR